jgi:hypothetical protein
MQANIPCLTLHSIESTPFNLQTRQLLQPPVMAFLEFRIRSFGSESTVIIVTILLKICTFLLRDDSLPVLERGAAENPAKDPSEVALLLEPDCESDLFHAHVGCLDQLQRTCQPLPHCPLGR